MRAADMIGMVVPAPEPAVRCPCGCGYLVSKGRKYASGGCYAKLRNSQDLRLRYPEAVIGKEAEVIIDAHIAAARPSCPACGATSCRLYDVVRDFLLSPDTLPTLRYECAECSVNYALNPANRVVFIASGVYFLYCQDFVKIGKTVDFLPRSRSYLTDNPYEIRLIGFIPRGPNHQSRFEERCHEHWRAIWHRGEWFHATPELLLWIQRKATKYLPAIMEQLS